MTKEEFISFIKTEYKCEVIEEEEWNGEPLDNRAVYQLFIDGFYGDFFVLINTNCTIEYYINVFDLNHSMHYGFEKEPAVFTRAYYKNILIALERTFSCAYEMTKSQKDDGYWGRIYTVIYCCAKFDVDFLKAACTALVAASEGMDTFRSTTYKQALLEIIAEDEDYILSENLHFDGKIITLNHKCALIFTDQLEDVIPNIRHKDLIEADDIYIGVRHAIIRNSKLNQMAIFDSVSAKLFNSLTDDYEIADVKYYSNYSNIVYAEAENLRLVAAIVRPAEVSVINEYEFLINQMYELKRIAPNISIKTSYSFSHLSASEFEILCFDLLLRKGFSDVTPIGKTNAPDRGVDIIAYEEYKTLFKTERRKWIFQCKHSKKSLDRKDVLEIGDLLEEHAAQGYGLFCSNSITPDATTRLEHKKERLNGSLQYYSQLGLSREIEIFPDLVRKYRLL